MDMERWIAKLNVVERRVPNFRWGYKFLFVPWDSLEAELEIVFISLMPSLSYPDGANLRLIAPEEGNDFENELEVARSQINKQFIKLTNLLGVRPVDVLTGVATPFRAKSWNDLNKEMKRETELLGRRFWGEALRQKSHKLIIVCGKETRDLIAGITGVNDRREVPSGWEDVYLRTFKTDNGKTVVHLPDLSRFKLLSRDECIEPLRFIFRDFID